MKVQDGFGFIIPVPLGAYLRILLGLEKILLSLIILDAYFLTIVLQGCSIFSSMLFVQNYRANLQMHMSATLTCFL